MAHLSKYLKLFFLLIFTIYAQEVPTKDTNSSDENLRLMYQVFTYSSDLKNAYKVAKKGVKDYPESLFWHKNLAQVAQWLDKRAEVIEQYIFIYAKTKDEEMGEKILSYALQSYQYEKAVPILRQKVLQNPSVKNIKDMIFVYDKVGSPEESAKFLIELSNKKNANVSWSLEAMNIYMQLGEMEKLEQLVKKIEKRENLDLNTTQKLSNYYISQKNIQKSYNILLRTTINNKSKESIKYYQNISDIGWYLQDPKNAAKASKQLFIQGVARLIDIERIIYYYTELEPTLGQKALLYGSKEFDNKYFYNTYITNLYEKKQYKKLAKEFEKIEKNKSYSEMLTKSYFWLMKGQTYSVLGNKDQALIAFKKALQLEDNSATTMETLMWFYIDQGNIYALSGQKGLAIKSFKEALRLDTHSVTVLTTLLWFYIDNKEHKRLKEMLFKIEESEEIDQLLWLPLAVANFSLQKPDRSMRYIKKLMLTNDKNLDIKLMYAYIMQAREETDAFMQTMQEVYLILDAQLKKDKNKLQEKKFLEQYLSTSAYFIDVLRYKELLLQAKSILPKKQYIELSIFWSLRHREYARARFLAQKLSDIEPWMQLNIALNNDDRTKQLDLLYKYHSILPIRDRVTTALNIGSISLAQTLAFDGLEDNIYDYLLYQQSRDLIERYADRVKATLGYLGRNNIDRSYLDIKNRYYIARGWSFLTDLFMAKNRDIDPKSFINIPQNDNSLKLGLRKEFDRGNMELRFGMRSAVKDYFTFSTKLHYKLMSRVNIDLGYYNSTQADETTYLLLAGKKDQINGKIALQYLPSSNISLALNYNKYYSQDDYYLGDGYYARLELYRQIHSGYPDIALSVFADYGNYANEYGDIGVVKDITPYRGRVLPEEFYNIGVNLFYGIINKETYTRVWRPFAEITPYYNGYSEQFNISFGGGYGGSLWGQDHLSIGFNYDQSVNGTAESTLGIYLNYHLFY